MESRVAGVAGGRAPHLGAAPLLTLPLVPLVVRLAPPAAVLAVWTLFGVALAVLLLLPVPAFRDGKGRLRLAFVVLAYPAAVTVLLAVFPGRPEVALVGWTVLAAGGGVAGAADRLVPLRPLPWRRDKSWGGLLVFPAAAAAGLFLMARLPIVGEMIALPEAGALLLPVLIAAVARTHPFAFGAALPVALAAGLAAGISRGGAPSFAGLLSAATLLPAAAVAAAAAAGVRLRLFDRAGGAAGLLLVLPAALAFGWRGLAPALFFVAAGSFFSRLRRGGRDRPRCARHAAANLAVAAFAAMLHLQGGDPRAAAAFGGALAAAVADTVAGEAGMFAGAIPRLITTGRKVAAGTDGGVSLPGTAAAAAASAAAALLCRPLAPATWLLPAAVFCGGLAGTTADSLLGAVLERRGALANADVNFLATLAGAATAAAIVHIVGS